MPTVAKVPTVLELASALEDATRWIHKFAVSGADHHDINNAKADIPRYEAIVTAARPPILVAGIEGVWSGTCDPMHGISINDYTDQNNLPACITTRQTEGAAYKKGASVWGQVKTCAKFGDVCDVLRAAGCKLHFYCRVD